MNLMAAVEHNAKCLCVFRRLSEGRENITISNLHRSEAVFPPLPPTNETVFILPTVLAGMLYSLLGIDNPCRTEPNPSDWAATR